MAPTRELALLSGLALVVGLVKCILGKKDEDELDGVVSNSSKGVAGMWAYGYNAGEPWHACGMHLVPSCALSPTQRPEGWRRRRSTP
jgi:hypothetical protein